MGAGRALAEQMERQSSELVSMPSLPEPRSPALYSLEDDEADGQEAAALLQDATSPPEGSGKPVDAKHRGDGDAVRPASDADSELSSEGQTRWRTGGRECIRLLQLAVPLIVQNIFGYGITLVGVITVGHLGTFELSAAILASSAMNITGFAFLVGLAGAMETLGGQAYGAAHYAMLGLTLQRGLLICFTFIIIGLPFWLHIEPLLILCGQNPQIAAGAARYMIMLLPALACQSIFQCLSRYLSVQSVVWPQTGAAAATVAVAPLINWLLVFKLGFGLDGAATATVLLYTIETMLLLAIVFVRDRRLAGTEQQTWHGWSLQSLKGWPGYLALAFPSAAMICTEWLTFEVMILLAGLLPNPQVTTDTTGIFLSICSLAYMAPLGLASAASTRVANALGARRPDLARLSALMTGIMTLISCLTLVCVALALRRELAMAFSNDPQVIAVAAAAMPILAGSLLGDGVNCAASGVVRGCGRQMLAATCNLINYWFIGIPIAVVLAFRLHWGVAGLWTGLLVATSIQGTTLTLFVACFNWDREAEQATARVKEAHRNHRLESGLDAA